MKSASIHHVRGRVDGVPVSTTSPGVTTTGLQHALEPNREVWLPGSHQGSRRAIRLPAVLKLVGCGRSHWYSIRNKKSKVYDPEAPLPFKLGHSPHSPTVWWEHEILEWLEARAKRRFY